MLPAFCRRWLPLVVSPVAVSATDTGVPVLTVHVGAIEKGAVHRAVGTSCSVLLLLRLDEGPDQAVRPCCLQWLLRHLAVGSARFLFG